MAVTSAAELAPRDPSRVAAVFPPWWSAPQSLSAAAGVAAVTGLGGVSFVVAVGGDPRDLGAKLRRAGALLILDGRGFPLCGAARSGASTR